MLPRYPAVRTPLECGAAGSLERQVSQERTEAVVLRGVDFSETSRVVTLLTPARGKLAVMAKGVRRKNSALAHPLGAFNLVEAVYGWKEGREVHPLFEVSLVDSFAGIRAHPEKPFFAALPVEMAYKAAQENEPGGELYDALVAGLLGLAAWTGDVRTHAAWQLWRLIRAAGFEPELEQCLESGEALAGTVGFSFAGGVVGRGRVSDIRLTHAQLEVMAAMLDAAAECPVEWADALLFRAAWQYARAQLETDFRSARVLHDMFGSA